MLSNDEIANILSQAFSDADISETDVGIQRDKALKYYRGDLYGDEKAGKSQVVTREVFEAVETLLPQLVDVFVATDDPVVFTPNSAADIDNAEMETKYVNHVFMNENDGFGIVTTWLFDAILQKNGVIRVYRDEKVREEQEEYESIPPEQFTLIQAEAYEDPDKLVIEDFTVNEDGTVNVTVKRTENNAKIIVENVAPEDFYVARDHNSVDLSNVSYCACKYRSNTYDLIADGYDKEKVLSLPRYQADDNASKVERNQPEQAFDIENETTPDCRIVETIEHYIHADLDQSDALKLWRVVTGSGSAINSVLAIEEADCVPYVSAAIMRNAHKYFGTSIADVVMDIQRVSSNLMRQALDNIYLSNAPTRLINTKALNKPESLANSVPGQAVGVDGDPNLVVKDLAVPFFAANVFEFFDKFKLTVERRTGTSEVAQGLSPDALADSTNMVGSMLMNAALQRVKFYARNFAETGMKPLMLQIHSLIRKYESSEKAFMVDGQFVPIDPRTWRKRDAMTAKVGLGYTEKRERITNLTNIIAQQKEILMSAGPSNPIVNFEGLYKAFLDFGKASGFPEVEQYFTNPAEYVPPAPAPDPIEGQLQVLREQILGDLEQTKAKIQADSQKNAEKLAQDRYEFDQELQLKRQKLDDDYKAKMEDLEFKYRQISMTPPPEVDKGGAEGETADE